MNNAVLEMNPQGFTDVNHDEMLTIDGGNGLPQKWAFLGPVGAVVAIGVGVYHLGHGVGVFIGNALNARG